MGYSAVFPFLSYYQREPYDVGTQKNRLTETILLSTHNIELEDQIGILENTKRPLSRALLTMFILIIL